MEQECFVITPNPPTIEKLQSKGIAMYMHGISVYYTHSGNQLNGPVWSRYEMNVRIKQGSNFVPVVTHAYRKSICLMHYVIILASHKSALL